jgi:hypothetical protein
MLQDNDVERETRMSKEQLDYVVEESWRWAIACEPPASPPLPQAALRPGTC